MKIMLYSQHVLGIGHFFRSMEIARALHRHDVLFVEGGDPLPGFVPPPHVRRLFLPSLMMDSEFKTMMTRSGNIDEIKLKRRRILFDSFLDFAPDIFITELFPFGRKQFRFEIMPVLEFVQRETMSTRIICSLRDILVEKEDQEGFERTVLDILNRYYNLVLVHSDPQVVSLNETFSQVDKILVPVRYTGFVVQETHEPRKSPSGKDIVASSGGGKVGVDFLASVIRAVQILTDHDLRLRVYIGPFMERSDRDTLEQLASEDSRVTLRPFALDYLAELASADLSISMAGYNTCMDILSARIKALVYPFPQNREQTLRATKLSRIGLLEVLDSLDIRTIALTMHNALTRPFRPPLSLPDLSGSSKSALLLEEFFMKK